MGDPTAAARHIRASLAPEGTWLLVEPMRRRPHRGQPQPRRPVFYSASTMICTLASRAQAGQDAACLGAQAGEARLRSVVEDAGFSRFRRAAETPFNLVLEVRP